MQTQAPRSSFSKKLISKLAESRFLTTSLAIHLGLVSTIGTAVLFKAVEEKAAFEVSEGSFLQPEQSEIVEASTERGEFEEAASDAEIAPLTPQVNSALGSLTSEATWSTPVSFNRMNIGATISGSSTMVSPSSMANPGRSVSIGDLGKPSSFTFMGIKTESRRAAFLLDASGSMILDAKGGGQAYADLKDKLVTLVDGMDPATEFNVIMFGDSADVFLPKAVAASDDNVRALKKWLEPYMKDKAGILRPNYHKSHFIGGTGTTRLDLALTAAFEMQAETIFILTDGTPSVIRAPEPEVLKKWEDNKRKNKSTFDRYDKDMAEYEVKYKEEVAAAKKKAAELNSSVSGRTQELYNWTSYAPHYPSAPPGYHRPFDSVDAGDFNKMLKEMHQAIYSPKGLPMPSVNIVGYHVNEKSEAFLQDMTKGIPGKYKAFRK